MSILQDVERVLISKEELAACVRRLARQIERDYADKNLLVVGILKGSVAFMADLLKEIDLPLVTDFMAVSSYQSGTVSTGHVKIIKDLNIDISGKDVLIIEDILDSGNTLSHLVKLLGSRGADSIKICALLNKPDRRTADIKLDYEGFVIPDEFVIGYGLDYDEKYRNLPFVGILKESVYRSKE